MSSFGIGPLQKVALLEIWRSHLLNRDAGVPSTVCNAYKHEPLTNFLKNALKFSEKFYISTENKDLKNKKMWFGEMPVQETVCRENSRRGNVGNCLFRELSFGELSVGELQHVLSRETTSFKKLTLLLFLQSWKKHMRQNIVYMWNRAVRENFNFYFSAFFC